MNQEEELFAYDEDDAVRFIRNNLPQELKESFSDDDINYIIDLIYEFYETKGFLSEDSKETVDIDQEELTTYVLKQSERDHFDFEADAIRFVIQGELDYCESLGVFE